MALGLTDGNDDGGKEGNTVGLTDGDIVIGIEDGIVVGNDDGNTEGFLEGNAVEGATLGLYDGVKEGDADIGLTSGSDIVITFATVDPDAPHW